MVMTPFCPLVAGQRILERSHHRTLFTAELKRYRLSQRRVADYDCDEADHLKEISYRDPLDAVLFELDYTWSINNLVTQRVEYDGLADETSTVVFDYDDRDRLISEERSGQNPYELYYTYDQLGNRLTKTDASDPNDLTLTAYFYDSDPDNRPEGYETNNNRLLWYEVWTDWTGQDEALARTVSYTYYKTGHASNITIKDESNPTHRYDLALYYARNGVLWLAAWGEYDIIEGEVENHEITGAREFRYDNPRARYMVRDLVTPTPNPEHATTPWYPANTWTYTDSEDLLPYADSTIVNNSGAAVFTQLSRYQTGLGIAARENIDQGQVDTTTHLHGDLIRSTNLTTDRPCG
jgi:YD repeat-containing protein